MKTVTRFAIALTAAATIATSAAAFDNYIVEMGVQDADQILEIGTVSAADAGMLKVYEFRTGTQGDLLATAQINAGANSDLRLQLNSVVPGKVLAVLYDGSGQMVTSEVIDRASFR